MAPRVIIIIENGKVREITSDTEICVYVVDLDENKEYISDIPADKKFVDDVFQ